MSAMPDSTARAHDDALDAKRYRWLRRRVFKEEGCLCCQGPMIDGYAMGHMGDALDEAIDAAITKEAKESE